MNNLAEQFLTPEQQQRIASAVAEAERLTSGEIVAMVVAQSDSHPLAAMRGALLLALPAAVALALLLSSILWHGQDALWYFLAIFPLLFLPLRWLIQRTPSLHRLFLDRDRADAEVREAALVHFFTRGLHRTRDENGILIFLSILERRVWILADRGIDSRLPPSTWNDMVQRLVTGIKANRQCETLCSVIEEISLLLAKHFPLKGDDRNELANLIIQEGDLPPSPHADS